MYSQSGEDGIIARIFDIIGQGNRFCCEFGAWDGIYLSNTRALIDAKWSALLIEGDPERFLTLQERNANNPRITCECAFVDAGQNSLARILERSGLAEKRIDLLSIDIDGLDYDVFSTLGELRHLPRLVLVEVMPEHGYERADLLPNRIARDGIGQPLMAFILRGRELGYRLICYHGNAFFIAENVGAHDTISTLSARDAWFQALSGIESNTTDAEYLYLRNLGLAGSPYAFCNPLLSAEWLGLSQERAVTIEREQRRKRLWRRIRSPRRWIVG